MREEKKEESEKQHIDYKLEKILTLIEILVNTSQVNMWSWG